jgi:hypothetical protein
MNATLTINLSAAQPVANYVKAYGHYFIKGIAPITFNLHQIQEETDPVLHIVGDFGDGTTYEDALDLHNTIESAGAIEIAESGKIMSITQNINHTYVKQTSSFVTTLTALFVLQYASSYTGTHKVLFELAKDSYYSTVKEINIMSTQLMPVTSHDVFAVANDALGNVFNLYLSKNELPIVAQNDDAMMGDVVLATRSSLPIVTRFSQYSIVPRLTS